MQLGDKHLCPKCGRTLSSKSPCQGLRHVHCSSPPQDRMRALAGFEGLALLDSPHPALSVGSVAIQVPIGFPPNKGWYFSSSPEVISP